MGIEFHNMEVWHQNLTAEKLNELIEDLNGRTTVPFNDRFSINADWIGGSQFLIYNSLVDHIKDQLNYEMSMGRISSLADWQQQRIWGGLQDLSGYMDNIGVDVFYENVVVFGASIIQGAFGRDIDNVNQVATDYLNVAGVNVYGYGWGGRTLDDGSDILAETIASFSGTKTLFVVHLGGNDVTDTKPYRFMSQVKVDRITDGFNKLYTTISPVINDTVVADLTFRDYGNTTVDDQDAGSFPYNENELKPRRLAKYTNTDGNSVVDLYNYVYTNNVQMLGDDNIHMTPIGYSMIMRFVLDRIRYLFTGDTMPDELVKGIPETEGPNYANPSAILLNFGGSNYGCTGVNIPATVYNSGIKTDLHDISGLPTPYKMEAFALSSTGNPVGTSTVTSGAIVLDIPFDGTLMSDPIHLSAYYWSKGSVVKHVISGLTEGDVVTIGFVGTRTAADARYTIIEDFSNPEVNSSYQTSGISYPPTPAEIIITANSNGEVIFKLYTGSSFFYISGIDIHVDKV